MRLLRARILAAGAAIGIISAGMLASPAMASTFASYGANYAGVAADARYVEVCDMEQDGRGVHGEFDLEGGGTMVKGDANGSAGGCGNQRAGANIWRLRVCETGYGCGPWARFRG